MKRRRFLIPFLSGLIACFLTISCAGAPLNSRPSSDQTVTLTLSAAASLQDVLEAIAPQFREAHPNIAVDYNFGSSGTLQQQIEQGAPADLFFSAAAKQMDALADKGLIVPDSRRNLVTNSLVLIAPKASTLDITDIAQLKDAAVTHFAVGEFRSVPAGQYAEQVLTKLDLLETLRPKFVFGSNVRSVLSAVESGSAELGMVYATDAALSDRVKVLTTVPAGSHQPIVYPIAVVKASPHPEAAQTLIDFLAGDEAQKTFAEFGFGQAQS
ncbi:molybdate ABC transporter substrate-binding protein [Nodosilinea nodulosa]|uniref:molybdate ABC transporter substrate-binding protein n=1 Tax=Nodosilinea nodulosa TaxID=416001 RepID=UPI000304FAF1|nr:molybdate ABC transporter substrate-binding protein [Nodosilinea nodulosa]